MSAPITAYYASILAIFYLFLSILVIKERLKHKQSLGDGGEASTLKIVRVHGNFAEYVPITLILLLLAEINQIDMFLLHGAAIALIFGRVLHAYGLRNYDGANLPRLVGMLTTFSVLILLSVVNLWQFYQV